MISKANHAACLAELASNPKSFSNCPDLHGGVPACPEVDFDLGSPRAQLFFFPELGVDLARFRWALARSTRPLESL